MNVDLIEHLGADSLVHGHFGNDRTDLTVRVQGTLAMRAGEQLAFSVTPDHLHVFDPDSGERLL
jgi:sn-glycerol 3-phosphate transport system ATP-binding protein